MKTISLSELSEELECGVSGSRFLELSETRIKENENIVAAQYVETMIEASEVVVNHGIYEFNNNLGVINFGMRYMKGKSDNYLPPRIMNKEAHSRFVDGLFSVIWGSN